MSTPLPFDDIDTPKSLLERIEERKLMSYQRLDNAFVSAAKVRKSMRNMQSWSNQWQAWKEAVCAASGKSWEEIAPIIYEGLV